MKILRLSLKNLNSFGRAIDLDFASPPLSETPLLAITGPTGSGKTTLLDAISVSLYNKTPRLSGNEQNNPVNLLRQGEKEGYAEVLFEVRGSRYIARWEVTRDRKGAMKPSAKLIDAASETLITARSTAKRGAKELEDRSVEDAVSEIVGLDFPAFNRSVMLAQGEFAAFLKAEPEKKREILQKIAGLDIYEILKKTLADRVKGLLAECASMEKALSQFSPVTAQDLEEEERRSCDIASEISGLQAEKVVISSKKEEETKRSETFRRLSDRKAALESLILRKRSIEETEKALKAAQRAVRARIEGDAYNTEAANKSQTELAVSEAEARLRTASAGVEAQALKRDEAEKAVSSFMKTRDGRIKAIEEARIEETMAGERRKQAEDTGRKLDSVKAEVIAKADEARGFENNIRSLTAEIESDERFLRDNEAPADADRRREEAAFILSALQGVKRNLVESDALHKKKAATEKELLNRRKDLEADLSSKEKAAETALKKLEESRKASERMLTDGNAELWESERARALSLQAMASEYEHSASRAVELEKSRNEIRNALASLAGHIESLRTQKDEMARKVASAESAEKEREREKERALVAGNVALLRREHLHEGEPCPVCGSCDHPWKEVEIHEGDEMEREARKALEDARHMVERHRQEMNNLEQAVARSESEKAHRETECLKIESDLQAFYEKMERCIAEWRIFRTEDAPSTHYIKEITDHMDKKLSDYRQAERLEQESKSSFENAQAKAALSRSELIGVIDQLSVISEEVEELGGKIEQHKDLLRKREEDFLRVIPARYHGKEWEQALRSFAEALDEISKRREKLSRKRPELERALAGIESMQSLIREKERDISALQEELKKLLGEEKGFRQSAMEKTGGLGADGAAAMLDKEQRRIERERDEALKSLQSLEEDRIRLQTELEQKSLQLMESRERSEKALGQYRKALEREGFASPEEHKSAFRDERWIDENGSMISKYNEDVRSTENQIDELERSFEGKAFDAGELGRIKAEEGNIDSALTEKLRREGELKGLITRMKDDLQKKKETGAMFENLCRERDRWQKLQSCINGNTLRDYALESVFRHLVYLARQQLLDITHRYELKTGGNFRISVLDRWNGCLERPVETLSGGETFLVSLSLALALSDLSRGHAELDSLFLDEGFGTLDSDTLEVVMATLEKLHLSGKKITLISHIHDLTRRIPVRIAVKRQGEGSSTISIEGE